jgi:fatty acid desaturase
MPIFSVSTLRTGLGDARTRVYAFSQRPASPAARFLAGLLALALIILALALFLILLIPAIAIALAVALFAAVSHSIRRALRNTTEPNGILDGRRNVRVVEREQEAP